MKGRRMAGSATVGSAERSASPKKPHFPYLLYPAIYAATPRCSTQSIIDSARFSLPTGILAWGFIEQINEAKRTRW